MVSHVFVAANDQPFTNQKYNQLHDGANIAIG